jgi:glycosyltransferase involved in cell wall biosynthesis
VETHQRGRSRAWYWKQVLAAIIVSFCQKIMAHPVLAVRAITMGWAICLLYDYGVGPKLLLPLERWLFGLSWSSFVSRGPKLLPGQRVRHAGTANLAYPESDSEFEQNGMMLANIVADKRVDVVHFASAGLASYTRYLGDAVPIFVTVHEKDLTRPWQRGPSSCEIIDLIKVGIAKAKRVFCVSEYTPRHVEGLLGILGEKVEVLTPGPRSKSGVCLRETEPPSILTVGKCVRRKGHIELLRALEIVNTPFAWDVVGDGAELGALAKAVAESQIRDRQSEPIGDREDMESCLAFCPNARGSA